MCQPQQKKLFYDEGELPTQSVVPFGVGLLALGSIQGLGQKGLRSLVAHYGDHIGQVLWQSEAELTVNLKKCSISGADKFAAIITKDPSRIIQQAEAELEDLEGRNIRVIQPSKLPERLRSINGDAPKWLFVEGSVDALMNRPVVAVVGTRTPTEKGLYAARIVATILAPYPVLMVSGLAKGIDCQAHYHSLGFGVKNLAFLGHGINHVFPEDTADIRRTIIDKGGAIVSEYMPDQTYQKHQFVERNRLQAALADIVIPVEAAADSGTAHTIRFARRYARTLVGMNWGGAVGIVDDLRANNSRLIDIFTSAGQRELDQMVKGILIAEGADTYPFKNLERFALREFGNRTYSEVDLQRLIEAITKVALPKITQESPADGAT